MASESEGSLKDENNALKDENVALKDDVVALKDENVALKVANASLRDKVDAMTSGLPAQTTNRSASDDAFDRAWEQASQPSIKYVKWEFTLNVQYHYNHTSPNEKLI